jgi:hypothetical protein
VERDHEESRYPIYRLSKCPVAIPIAGHGPVPFVSGKLFLLFPPIAA